MPHEPKTKLYGDRRSAKKILLAAPRHPDTYWNLDGTVELLGAKSMLPNTALCTLMALTPPDVSVEYTLADENVGPLDWETPWDLVCVTGFTTDSRRIEEICRRFRSLGRRVALGGPFASLEPERCRELADHHFIGEAELTWPQFLRDWQAGRPRAVYRQEEYVDLGLSPAPDWSLIEPSDYLQMAVQTSRGCPHRCDFCDVIQYVGQKFRTKSVDQVMLEVENAQALGTRAVFFSDDNFAGNREYTRELLTRLVEWNTTLARPLTFAGQVTVQVGDDPELLRLLSDARFNFLFLGVESPRRANLEEIHKTHNLKRDLVERIDAFSRHGIIPSIGLILGFDHDDPGVFDDLRDFIKKSAAPIVCLSMLNAPRRTPLFARLKSEGRLVKEYFDGEWQLSSNIIPKLMTREELAAGYWRLFRDIYDPEAFLDRLIRWAGKVEYQNPEIYRNERDPLGEFLSDDVILKNFLLRVGPEMRQVFRRALKGALAANPSVLRQLMNTLAQYRNFREFVETRHPRE